MGRLLYYWTSIERYKRITLEFFTRFGSDLLSHVLRRSTISATVLNDWVRNGARCFTRAMTTKPRKEFTISSVVQVSITVRGMCMTFIDRITSCLASTGSNQAYRAISTSQLNTLLRLHLWPIDEVVYLGSQGYLVLRGASRLDAFSGYPVRS